MDYVINIKAEDTTNARELKATLPASLANESSTLEGVQFQVREPKPVPGSLASLDPEIVQVAVSLISGTGALAIALRGLFRVLEKYVETRKSIVKVTLGKNTIEFSGSIPPAERERMVQEFIQRSTS